MARLSEESLDKLDKLLKEKYGLSYSKEQLQETGKNILIMASVKQIWNDILDEHEANLISIQKPKVGI